MISAITGELKRVDEEHAHVQCGSVLYELAVPAIDISELQGRVGEELIFHTIFYLQGDGNSFEPQLIGFLRPEDRKFFQHFITVKGIGPKTALRALTVPVGQIADAIESRDARALTQLKGIGKRTAELIIAELGGKVAGFAAPAERTTTKAVRFSDEDEASIAVLVSPQMGLRRPDAERLLIRVKDANPGLKKAEQLVPEMLRLHATGR
jgi:Holliday junction DNA helicase RuvA